MPVVQVKLPDIGEGIAEGEIVRWLVKEGEAVKRFQPIVEVLTAKATVEIPSPYTGRIHRLLASEGDTVRVGQPIVEIETDTAEPGEPQEPVEKVREQTVEAKTMQEAPARGPTAPPSQGTARVRAPPSVRLLARKLGIDLSKVKGTGPRGVVTKNDVLAYAEAQRSAPQPAMQVAREVGVQEERIPLRGVKKVMAERMVEAKTRIPHAYVVEEVDITELLAVREKLKPLAEEKGVKLTVLPFIMKAVVKAIREYPLMNSSLDEERGEIVVRKTVNLGFAVDTPHGLMVPVIKNADSKGLFQLAREVRELAARAREAKLGLDEVRGSTFSISNYGSIGGVLGIPVINPPEAAILGVGRIRREPRIRDGRIEERSLVYLTLSFDHRILEGGYATRFLVRVKELLENPILLLAGDGELD
ncbi:MAG: 2-oxo acid dehydrogenase subunit E2 [Desulfurococcales archaeon]|nr:2-oxo acid dehydrogenase subunit E2 [Desulfurococcales archaeon]